MIKSMTGYGRAQQSVGGRDITVELRAVNHRYLEYSSRLPRAYAYLDDKLKKLVQASVSRGKVELALTVVATGAARAQVAIDSELAEEYLNAMRSLGQQLGVEDDVTLSTLTRFGDIFVITKPDEDEEQLWTEVSAVAQAALESFVEMRCIEGERMRADILSRLDSIEAAVSEVERRSPRTVAEYRERLTAKLNEILGDNTLDPQRVVTEVAIIGEKLAVDEETVRLRSHIAQLRAIVSQPEAVGRKLDFLVQEMNREINTIGSKAQDLEIARIVVDVKSEIEKIREQVQNIE